MNTSVQERFDTMKSAAPARRRLTGVAALVASVALAFSASTPSFAATGAQTGEWDIVATSQSQSPRLQSYNHDDEEWDTVFAQSAWFAVGSEKIIDGDEDTPLPEQTPVRGGGFRFENTAATPKQVKFTLYVPPGTGLTITDPENGNALVGSVPVNGLGTLEINSEGFVAPGDEFHHHYTWEFSGRASTTTIRATVSVKGAQGTSTAGNYDAGALYRFTF